MLYIEAVKLIIFNVESKENLALKGRLATITKHAIQKEIALTTCTMSCKVKARDVSIKYTKAV